ncbi:MAG: ABC transporter permease, partial [Bdellovibrionales bacterium]|nr:ABC transporter permease [Bdellovibrionales bacterium]
MKHSLRIAARVAEIGVRNVWRNPKRTAFTVAAVAVGLWSALALSALARGLNRQMVVDAVNDMTGHVQLHAPGYLDDPTVQRSMPPLDAALREALARPDITAYASRVRVPAVVMSERDSAGVTFFGIQPEREVGLSFIPDTVASGRYLEDSGDEGIIIGAALARKLETGLGKRVVLMSEGVNGAIADRGFRVVGLYRAQVEGTEKAYAFTGLHTAQAMLGLG